MYTKERITSVILTLIFCSSRLLAGGGDVFIDSTSDVVIEGQAGWVFFDVSGGYGAREAVLAGEEQEIGNAGDIHIQP